MGGGQWPVQGIGFEGRTTSATVTGGAIRGWGDSGEYGLMGEYNGVAE